MSLPQDVDIREVHEDDAEALLALHLRLDRETSFMLAEPGERPDDVEAERERIRGLASRSNQTVLVAEARNRIVGYVAILGGAFRRNRNTAHLVIGVEQAFSGRGVGGALLDAASRWAASADIHRLELTVMASNDRAIRLYERKGFTREGLHKDSLQVAGSWVDELTMAKLLPAS